MKQPIIPLAKALSESLVLFLGLTESFEKREPGFAKKLDAWLKATESLLAENGLSEAARIAGIRCRIASFRAGTGRRGKAGRKEIVAFEGQVLYEIQASVELVLNKLNVRIDPAKEIINHLLIIICQSGQVKYSDFDSFAAFINGIWKTIVTHENYRAAYLKLKLLLNISDILLVIADEVNSEDF